MNRPVLKLHIGIHKTGTTYIQSLLQKQRKRLMAEGFLYPLAGLHGTGHAALAANYLGKGLRENMRKSNIFAHNEPALTIRDNILYEYGKMKNRDSTVIVSAEGLCLADHESVQRFAEHYHPYFEIKVIVFLRRQDFMAESGRAQAYLVNQVGFNPLGAFEPKNINYDFASTVDRWSSQFGENSITVAEYPEQKGVQALRIMTFDIFGLPNSLKVDNKRVNERLSRDVLEYIFEHSNLVYGTKPYFRAIERLSQYSSQSPSASKYSHFYSPQERLKILDTHKATNKLVTRKYKSDLFDAYPAIDIDEEWELYPGLTEQQIAVFDNLLAGDSNEI